MRDLVVQVEVLGHDIDGLRPEREAVRGRDKEFEASMGFALRGSVADKERGRIKSRGEEAGEMKRQRDRGISNTPIAMTSTGFVLQ